MLLFSSTLFLKIPMAQELKIFIEKKTLIKPLINPIKSTSYLTTGS